MSMSLRVVVPPHPLIGHWLTLLRDRRTPSPLFATSLAELGRWLSYEACRDWLPHRRLAVETPNAVTEGTIVDPDVGLLAIPLLRQGLGLWQGAQTVLPAAAVAHAVLRSIPESDTLALEGVPDLIDERVGVIVFDPVIGSGRRLITVLEALERRGVVGERLRVITALAASPGLKALGERFPQLTIYAACIDPELDAANRPLPGLGDVEARLFGTLEPNCLG